MAKVYYVHNDGTNPRVTKIKHYKTIHKWRNRFWVITVICAIEALTIARLLKWL